MDSVADDATLLELHAAVLFDIDAADRLTRVNEPEGDRPPRLFVARGRSAVRMWLGADVSAATADACRALAIRLPIWDERQPAPEVYADLVAKMAEAAPVVAVSGGPAYRFGEARIRAGSVGAIAIDDGNADLLVRHFPYMRSVLDARSPVTGVAIDGVVVSACYSARKRDMACEAGVATEEPFRARGFGAVVVAAWRKAVEREGRLPLYSTAWTNVASRALARTLDLIPYADTMSVI
jgi:hypothetical protein